MAWNKECKAHFQTSSNNGRRVDMHVHTNESDGVWTPTRVVEAARDMGLAAISITDHDAVTGIPAAVEAGKKLDIEVMNGIEFTAERNNRELHILGYGIDPHHAEVRAMADRLQQSRFDRAKRMVDKLADLGIKIDFDAVLDQAGPGNIGRPHIARALLEGGHISSLQEAFDRYISRGKPAYADRWRVEPEIAIDLIHDAGGLAFLAHPKLRNASDHIGYLADKGLDGLEVFHSRHSARDATEFTAIADKLGLLKSGGTDCHGPSREGPALIGTQPVPYDYFQAIERALAAT